MRSTYGNYTHITTATTTVVKKGTGVLIVLINNKSVAGSTITIYDGIDNTGSVIAIITNPATLLSSRAVLPYFTQFTTGLTIVTSGADDLTVITK